MTCSTLEVAACSSSASCSSRVRRATSASWPAIIEELRAPTDSGALHRFGVTALWRCGLARSPPALERRLIAFPKAQDKALGQISTLEVARHALKYGMLTATAPAASPRSPRCVALHGCRI